MKSLHKENWGTESADDIMGRIRTECGIYLAVDHPNIVRLRDMYETDESIFLVCDCCEGGELYDRLKTMGQYSERDAAKGMKGMLNAVAYIHQSLNIVHRDLKLQNFLYPTKDAIGESIKLIDFGFSKHLHRGKDTVVVTAGTVEYLAPELFHRESKVEHSGDMWAMGVILFMLLGGYPPFAGRSNNDICDNIRAEKIVWYKSRWGNVGWFLFFIKISYGEWW